jgi:hypothetical protein
VPHLRDKRQARSTSTPLIFYSKKHSTSKPACKARRRNGAQFRRACPSISVSPSRPRKLLSAAPRHGSKLPVTDRLNVTPPLHARTVPSPTAKEPPAGPGRIHEINHDGFRILARRDAKGVRPFARNGYDFASRFPNVDAVAILAVRSCVVDGEAVLATDKLCKGRLLPKGGFRLSIALEGARSVPQ